MGSQVVGGDCRVNEILRTDGIPEEPTEHRQLSGMRHRIGELSLKHLLFGQSVQRLIAVELFTQACEHVVKPLDLITKCLESVRAIFSSDKEGSRIPQNACHMAYQLHRSSHIIPRSKVRKIIRRPTERLLCAIRESPQKMPEHVAFVVHHGEHYSRFWILDLGFGYSFGCWLLAIGYWLLAVGYRPSNAQSKIQNPKSKMGSRSI